MSDGAEAEAGGSAMKYETDRFRSRSLRRFPCGTPGCCQGFWNHDKMFWSGVQREQKRGRASRSADGHLGTMRRLGRATEPWTTPAIRLLLDSVLQQVDDGRWMRSERRTARSPSVLPAHICGRLGRSFWSRGYGVSTVGFDEESIREYIQEQEEHEKREEQGGLMFD